MKKFGTVLMMSAVLLGVFAVAPKTQAAEDPLTQALAKLDVAAAKFSSAQADFEWDTFQKIVNDTDKQYGKTWFKRAADGTEMRADVSSTPGGTATQIVIFTGGKLEMYQPAINDMKVFSADKNRGQYESFLTLGMGGSGTDLKKNWIVGYGGTEKMQGITVTKLELDPIDAGVKKLYKHVTIWVDLNRGVSLQQLFLQPSGDSRTVIYTNITLQPIKSSVFQMPIKKSTKVEQVQ